MNMKSAIKRFCIVIVLFTGTMRAQDTLVINPDYTGETRPKIGLVLSGGGAKGSAHIGVLKVLEELQIPIDYIVGTSMGSIMGGLYSIGYRADELDTLISNLDWSKILSNSSSWEKKTYAEKRSEEKYLVSVPFHGFWNLEPEFEENKSLKRGYTLLDDVPSGFISGQNVLNLFTSLSVGYHGDINFDSLPIPLAIVAVDLVTGKEHVYRSGSLPDAIRTSMSIPGVFSPVYKDGKVLVDGGLANNFPVDVALEMGADIVIGVDVGQSLVKAENLNNLYGVLMQVVELLKFNKLDENRNHTDFYIAPNTEGFSSLSFSKESVGTLISNGLEAAEQSRDYLEGLRAMLDSCGYDPVTDKPAFTKASNIQNDTFCLSKVQFNGISDFDKKMLMRQFDFPPENVCIPDVPGTVINDIVSTLYASSAFSKVNYRLEGDIESKSYDLIFDLEQNPSNSISFGARFDLEEYAKILLNITLNRHRLFGPKASFSVLMGVNPYLDLNLAYSTRTKIQLNLYDKFYCNNFKIFGASSDLRDIHLNANMTKFYISGYSFRNFDFEIGAKMDNFFVKNFALEKSIPSWTYPVETKNYFGIYMDVTSNSLNANTASGTGINFDLKSNYYLLSSDTKFSRFATFQLNLRTAFQISPHFNLSPSLFFRTIVSEEIPLLYGNMAGGWDKGRYLEQQIPFIGINYMETFDKTLTVLRCDFQYQITERQSVAAIVNYGNHVHDIKDYFNANDMWGWGIAYGYNIPFVGPARFGLHWSNKETGTRFMFSLGYNF